MTNDFYIDDNGKKKQLNKFQHGVRREQVDEKYRNLFDAYDINNDGTLEQGELKEITKSFSLFAGSDNTLDRAENKNAASLFSNKANIKDADLMGFVKSVSDASKDIVSSEESTGEDGGKIIKTAYKNGLIETIYYYPDGEFKLKTQKLDSTYENTTYLYTDNGKDYKECSRSELEQMVNDGYEKFSSAEYRGDSSRSTFKEGYTKDFLQAHNVTPKTDKKEIHIDNTEMSDRAKYDAAVRDFVLTHFVETHKSTQEALDTMGFLDDIGAAVNADAGELWNACKNIYNKYFGDGTEEDYQNFYELVKKFQPNYDKALIAEGRLEWMRQHPVGYFTDETGKINTEKGLQFQQITEQYQNAMILKSRADILNKAMLEISMYENEQNALMYAPAQNDGLNPASHIVNAKNLLLQYFDNDQKAVDMLLDGAIGNAEATADAIKKVKEENDVLYKNVLDGKTFEEIKAEYQKQYKAMYNTDFVPDELTDKVMAAKMTGGMVKLAAITIISILVTRSPVMIQLMGATSTAATGAAANMIRTLTARYPATVVQQGIKFAMTSGTLATDVGFTLLNQLTSKRGYNGEELWESAKSSAKYIYFGAYIGAPLAQGVSKAIGKFGATSRLFEGGVKTTQGATQATTTITGDKLVQNFVNGGSKLQKALATGGSFLTEVGAFTGLEIATEGIDPLTAGEEQVEMLGKLKIMNHFLEYMLGGKVHAGMSKAKMDAAIEQSGVKNWTITEIKNPNKTVYEVRVAEGLPPIRLEDANQLATVMLERVCSVYAANEARNAETKTDNAGDKADETAAPKGLNTEDNAFIQKAKTENPAEVVEGKVRKAWQESGLTEEVPEEHVDLFNLDPYAGLKESAPEVNGEVTHLIFNGKLKETLTQHYERLEGVFDDIAQKRSSDFKKAAEECGSDKQAFAQRVVEILAEEMGMQDCKPNIKLTEMGDADGMANWQTGTIEINKNTYSAEKLVEIISHEYVHMLQYRDIIAQYGEKGLKEVIMADKKIPENEKETRINDVLNSEYTQKLLENRDRLLHAETGSLNEYRMRIYKDEFANNIGTEDMPRYTNQVSEVEAYNLGSHALGENTELDGITVGESAPNDKLLQAARQKLKERLKNGETLPEKNSDTEKTAETPEFTVNEDGSVSRVPKGVITETSQKTKELEAQKKTDETSDAAKPSETKAATDIETAKSIEDCIKISKDIENMSNSSEKDELNKKLFEKYKKISPNQIRLNKIKNEGNANAYEVKVLSEAEFKMTLMKKLNQKRFDKAVEFLQKDNRDRQRMQEYSEKLASEYKNKIEPELIGFTKTIEGREVEITTIIREEDKKFYKAKGKDGEYSARSKGAMSVFSKIKNKILALKEDIPEKMEEADALIGDAGGFRFTINEVKSKDAKFGLEDVLENIPPDAEEAKAELKRVSESIPTAERAEFDEYFKESYKLSHEDKVKINPNFEKYERGIYDAMVKAQSDAFVKKLCNGINADEIRILELNNYCGHDGIPYFSKEQINSIELAYKNWFDKACERKEYDKYYDENNILNYIVDKDGNKFYKALKIEKSLDDNGKATKNIKESGYTSSQFNVIGKNGLRIEVQYRSEKINEFAEYEHVPYDIRQGKDTVEDEKYNSIRKILNEKMSPDEYKHYNRYLTQVYNYNRRLELGLPVGEKPRLNKKDFPNLTLEDLEQISDEGLKKLHGEK